MVEIVREDDLDAPDHTSDHRAPRYGLAKQARRPDDAAIAGPDCVRPLPKLVKIF